MRTMVLAHRGTGPGGKENSVAGASWVLASGADGAEIDVRMTADSHLVLAHDIWGDAVIEQTSLDELNAGPEGDIALLADYLRAAPELIIDLELKGPTADAEGFVGGLAGVLREHPAERIFVSSFWLPLLAGVRDALPSIRCGVLTAEVYDPNGTSALEWAISLGVDLILPQDRAVSMALVQHAHAKDIEVVTWTVDSAARITELCLMGVDGIITDDPSGCLSVVEAHRPGT